MGKASMNSMNELHGLLARKYADMLSSDKELTAAELNAIASFLKQNDITVDITEAAPMQDLVANAMNYFSKQKVS